MEDYLGTLNSFCEAQLASAPSRAWWAATRSEASALTRFESTAELRDRLADQTRSLSFFHERDRILRQLLIAHRMPSPLAAQSSMSLWLLIYWPLFLRTVRQLSHSSLGRLIDLDDLRSEVIRQFLELLASLNLEVNRDIHTSLIRRHWHLMSHWARAESRARSGDSLRFDSLDPNVCQTLPLLRPQDPRGGWELDAAHRAFDELLEQGVIDEISHELLVSTKVHRLSLKEAMARPANSNEGLGYEASRKRRSRAQSRIRDHMDRTDTSLVDLAIRGFERS